MEDIRNHDTAPTEQESEWMAQSAIAVVIRAVALAGIALSVGWGTSVFIDHVGLVPPIVAETSR